MKGAVQRDRYDFFPAHGRDRGPEKLCGAEGEQAQQILRSDSGD
jgi:hypothetical protein